MGGAEDLELETQGSPDALIFKQTHKEALRATVCGECGNVGLSVKNPKVMGYLHSSEESIGCISDQFHKLGAKERILGPEERYVYGLRKSLISALYGNAICGEILTG